MEAAIPMDLIDESDGFKQNADLIEEDLTPPEGIDLSLPTEPEEPFSFLAVVPRTTGKLFFTTPNGDCVCSASAVNNPNKNLVSTAAHCVHGGGSSEQWFTNICFVPAYFEGKAPFGMWYSDYQITFKGWTQNRNYDYDQALFTVLPREGRNLVDVVGGNGLSYNFNQAQQNVRITGYPAQSPYTGELPYSCYGDTFKRAFNNDAYMNCDMTGGASGGAWFRTMASENVGQIFAVTSRRSTTGQPRLFARPFTSDLRNLYDTVSN
ncbi:hypothetical protein MKZ27_05410 [Bacillus sp. FSL R5-0394]